MVKTPIRYDWCYSIFSNYDQMEKSTTFSAPFLCSSLPPDTKILRPRISFRVNTTDIDNQYDIYSRTCAAVSSMLEVVDSNVSYAPVYGIWSLCIIIAIASVEGLIILVLDISDDFKNIFYPILHKESILVYHIYTWNG